MPPQTRRSFQWLDQKQCTKWYMDIAETKDSTLRILNIGFSRERARHAKHNKSSYLNTPLAVQFELAKGNKP